MITKEETIKRFIIKKNMEIEKDLLKRIGSNRINTYKAYLKYELFPEEFYTLGINHLIFIPSKNHLSDNFPLHHNLKNMTYSKWNSIIKAKCNGTLPVLYSLYTQCIKRQSIRSRSIFITLSIFDVTRNFPSASYYPKILQELLPFELREVIQIPIISAEEISEMMEQRNKLIITSDIEKEIDSYYEQMIKRCLTMGRCSSCTLAPRITDDLFDALPCVHIISEDGGEDVSTDIALTSVQSSFRDVNRNTILSIIMLYTAQHIGTLTKEGAVLLKYKPNSIYQMPSLDEAIEDLNNFPNERKKCEEMLK